MSCRGIEQERKEGRKMRKRFPLKAGFHLRRSRSRSRNQKGRAIRSSENQTDGVGSRTLILSPLLTIK